MKCCRYNRRQNQAKNFDNLSQRSAGKSLFSIPCCTAMYFLHGVNLILLVFYHYCVEVVIILCKQPSYSFAASSQGGFMSDIVKTYKQMLPYGHFIGYSLARICTIHMNKVVYVIMTYTVTREVGQALHLVRTCICCRNIDLFKY